MLFYLKKVLHMLLGYKIEISIPNLCGNIPDREIITARCFLNHDCTVRCFVLDKQCYLEPKGTVRGLPTTWNATWKKAI